MALTGPLKYINIQVVSASDVAAGSFEESQLNAGTLPPMKFAGETVPFNIGTAIMADYVAPVTAVDATTEATGWALANANKTAINDILTALKAAELMETSG